MKPSLTSCCLSTSSLYCLRISINDDISISLNVVRNAAVFCDSFSRSAMRRRIRLILTRFSFRKPPATAGVGAGLLSSFGAGAGLLVTFVSVLLLGAGLGVLAGGGDGSCLVGAFDSPESFSGGGGGFSDAAGEDVPPSPGAKRNRSCPTVTVSSSLASSSVIFPEAGALTDTSICERVKQRCQPVKPSPKWVQGRSDKKGRGREEGETRETDEMSSRVWRCGTYLVGLDSGDLFVGLDRVTDLLLPSLECAFRDGLGHLRHLDGLICSQRNITSVTMSRHCPRAVKSPYPLAISSYGRGHGAQAPCNVHAVSGQSSVMCV
jgi:hypothetical protein